MKVKANGKDVGCECDRCGVHYYMKDTKKEWTGLRVCQTCWNPKDPVDHNFKIPVENIAVKDARPNTEIAMSVAVVATITSGESTPGDGTPVLGGFEWYLPNGINHNV